jgi:transaldolase
VSAPTGARRRAVFLDRDGVLNEAVVRERKPYPPQSPDEVVVVPGMAAACDRLRRRGFVLVVVTNQPDVARGRQSASGVAAINAVVAQQVGVDAVYVCLHDNDDECACRKPKPGMLLDAARDLNLDLNQSFMVGDRWSDIAAGQGAGCTTVYIDAGYQERGAQAPDHVVSHPVEALEWILSTLESEEGAVSDQLPYGIKIFADGADLEAILRLSANPVISGFTTNPTLMRKSGVEDYAGFARKVLDNITQQPISFEVLCDEFDEMRDQARTIASWGPNVFVKIPVTNTRGESAAALIKELSAEGLHLNVTAILSLDQVRTVVDALADSPGAVVSVFAGRIADTGRDPVPIMTEAVAMLAGNPRLELLWASPREILNVAQAAAVGCHIITVTPDLLAKLPGLGRGLEEVSLDTVRMFFNDAQSAGFLL